MKPCIVENESTSVDVALQTHAEITPVKHLRPL